MRRLLTFSCDGATLGATLDEGRRSTGLLFVTGGTQTRVGAHRLYERLASRLAAEGYACFRFDRRGVGDSEGEDPGYRGSAADLSAAASCFRAKSPGLAQLVGIGLCDGATALALFGGSSGLGGAVLINPWLVEAAPGDPAPAAVRHHYRAQLGTAEGWKRLLTGAVSYRKLLRGIARAARPQSDTLAEAVATALEAQDLPVAMILASQDATAIAALDVWNGARFDRIRARTPPPLNVATDAHSFSRSGDQDALLAACLGALAELDRRVGR